MKNCDCDYLRYFRTAQEAFISQAQDCEGYLDVFLENPKRSLLWNPTIERIENLRDNRRLHGERYDSLRDAGKIVFANVFGEVRGMLAASVLNFITFDPIKRYFDACASCYGRVERYDASHLDRKVRIAESIMYDLGLSARKLNFHSNRQNDFRK